MRKLELKGDDLDLSLEWPKNVSTNPYERTEDLLAQSMQISVGEKTEWFALRCHSRDRWRVHKSQGNSKL